MAVIEDLPPELLLRILELTVGDKKGPNLTLHDLPERRATFVNTSLVARSWRAPSQHVLAASFTSGTYEPVWKQYATAVYKGVSSSPTQMHGLLVILEEDSADQLALLQRGNVELQHVDVFNAESGVHLELDVSHAQILKGLRALELHNRVEVSEDRHCAAIPLQLEELYIRSRVQRLPAFLRPLSVVAPRLTRLDLEFFVGVEDQFIDAFNEDLKDVAPRLHQLHLSFDESTSGPDGACTLSYERLLSACTSLTTLNLTFTEGGVERLHQFLSFVPAPIKLLSVQLGSFEEVDEERITPSYLDGVLALPSIAQLRRWRLSFDIYESRRDEVARASAEEQRNIWEAACRARGIEPRGHERYFTD